MHSHLLSQQIRRDFLSYFKKNNHLIVPSSSLIPHDDPTLLFINAGMNQFKDVFLGKHKRDYATAVTSQKCIRVGGKHNDLENVGHTSRHLTFFEMLGNFSFGDYFKEQSIKYAWEVSTEVFKLDADRIWATIFRDDDEAFEIWRKILPEKRIVRLGEKDNFWSMGDTGPCGPCSELLFDRGNLYGPALSPAEDASGERYLEFWNLVFMQFNRNIQGEMAPLPKQSIDTGSGLERVVSLKMGVDSVFATDILGHLISRIETLSQKKYDPLDLKLSPAFHVIADHIRSLSFAIADGAQPSNTERGYVLRKILRRAVRYGRMLGMHDPFLSKLLPSLIEVMGEDYGELKHSENRICEILFSEEEAFLRTLKRGGNILNSTIETASQRAGQQISGQEAFKLKDTYGLPLEEILLIAKDASLSVDLEAFSALEKKAKEISRSAQASQGQEVKENFYKDYLEQKGASVFTGFNQDTVEAEITAIIKDGHFVSSLLEKEEGDILLDKTAFYAEKGGQVGDTGSLEEKENLFAARNCLSPYTGIILHSGVCEKGSFKVGQKIKARIDAGRRNCIQNNHTATHLLHFALEKVLGPHIKQAGSLVEPNRLRFDFSHHKGLTKEELLEVEEIVNEKIRENTPVNTYEISYTQAQKTEGIKQFFGEKYDSTVRVVDIDYSKELCGGSHAKATGSIGFFRITKESSVAAGTRRIEATTGKNAEEFTRQKEAEYELKILEVLEQSKKLQQQVKLARKLVLSELAGSLETKIQKARSISFIATKAAVESSEMAPFSEEVMGKYALDALFFVLVQEDRCHLFVKISPKCVKEGLLANSLIKELSPLIEGSGGGRPDFAQAGGKNLGKEEALLKKFKELIENFSQKLKHDAQ